MKSRPRRPPYPLPVSSVSNALLTIRNLAANSNLSHSYMNKRSVPIPALLAAAVPVSASDGIEARYAR